MSPLRQRSPREVSKDYKSYIAALPCLICGTTPVHVCHVRFAEACPHCQPYTYLGPGPTQGVRENKIDCAECFNSEYRYGKRPTGAGEKPSDWWTWPGCPECHLHGPEAQHSSGERQWFEDKGLDILHVCTRLQDAWNTALSRTDAIEGGVAVLEEFRT